MRYLSAWRWSSVISLALVSAHLGGCTAGEDEASLNPDPGVAQVRSIDIEEAPELLKQLPGDWQDYDVAAFELTAPSTGWIDKRWVLWDGERSSWTSRQPKVGEGRTTLVMALRVVEADEAMDAVAPLLDDPEEATLRERLEATYYYEVVGAHASAFGTGSIVSQAGPRGRLELPEPRATRIHGPSPREGAHLALEAGEPRIVYSWAWPDAGTAHGGPYELHTVDGSRAPVDEPPYHVWQLELTYHPADAEGNIESPTSLGEVPVEEE